MNESESRSLDRRQLLKAGAWAAPVLLVAASVPAAAASTPIPPASITLGANCTGVGSGTSHGFTIRNTSTQAAIVFVSFTAQAWGITPRRAIANVVSATSTGSATYYDDEILGGEILDGLTYQTLWETRENITVDTSSVRSVTAHREGGATFSLPPGAAVRIGQVNLNALGEPVVTALVSTINGTFVEGQSATFSFELGGRCVA